VLKSVKLSFTDPEICEISTEGVTIFVGPNNSGKSLILREIEQQIENFNPIKSKIVKDYNVHWPDKDHVTKYIDSISTESSPVMGNLTQVRYFHHTDGQRTHAINLNSVLDVVENKQNKHYFAANFLRFGLVRLTGRTRFELVDDQTFGDLLIAPINNLSRLFQSDRLRELTRKYIYDAFQLYFVIDPNYSGHLRVRLSSEAPTEDEQSLSEKARNYHRKALYIKDASDGIQAYTGIIMAVASGDYHTILIDEPEAFLHPPLAKKLGFQLSSLALQQQSSLLLSTHSSDLLMGCMQGNPKVRIVRLQFNNGTSSCKILEPDRLNTLFKNPLMRSVNAASALFYDGAVITESENDRAFYSEIYTRLTEENSNLPSIVFINAQNIQTIYRLVGPLREFGVPAVGIADLDIINQRGANWKNIVQSARIPRVLKEMLRKKRDRVAEFFCQRGIKAKSAGGVFALSDSERDFALDFINEINNFGIFPVPTGELESWLSDLNISSGKSGWVARAFDRLGNDPKSSSYVRPNDGDVWEFMRKVASWIADTSRKGM